MSSSSNDFQDAKLWDLPSVDDALADPPGKTNALNKPKGKWQYEPPEQTPEVKPLTAEDIESIRQAAYQEGLASGHEEGLAKGQEEGYQKGLEQGIEEGNKEGFSQGQEQAKQEAEEQMQVLKELCVNLSEPSARVNDELKKELVLLSCSLAKAVIQVESEHNQNVLKQAIEQGIAALPLLEGPYQLSLHPQDLAIVQQQFNQELLDKQQWQLVENSELARGGVKIQCLSNAVDVSIERRTQAVFSKLLLDQGLHDDPRAS